MENRKMSLEERKLHVCSLAGVSGQFIDERVELFRNGKLTDELAWFTQAGNTGWFLRDFFTEVSWALYTTDFANRLSAWMTDSGYKTVIEVCAGRGLLARMMKSRGVAWKATDLEAYPHVSQGDALQVAKSSDADLLVASWVPYKSTLDIELAREWVEKKEKPMLLIGEGQYGCTGSIEFWDNYWVQTQMLHSTLQLLSWNGIKDTAFLVSPNK